MNEYGRRDTFRTFSQHTDVSSVYSPSVYPASRQQKWPQDASMLEFSDDSRSSSFAYEDDDEEDDDSAASRMSIGPKMRFHSPAPWEDDSNGEDGQDFHEPSRKKPFSFGNSSPRFSTDSRPSTDSSRFKSKKSTDGEKPRSGLHALVQIGHNSQRATSPPHSLKIPSHSHSTQNPSSPVPSFSPYSSSLLNRSPSPPNSEYSSIHPGRDSTSSPEHSGHPFANPKLAYHGSDPPSPARSTFSAVQLFPRNDSSVTVTTSFSSNLPASPTRHRDQDKSFGRKWEISGPIPVHQGSLTGVSNPSADTTDPRVLALMPRGNPTDFTSYPDRAGPAFQLISLEEAREQRKRSQTADSASIISGTGDTQSISDRASFRTRARSISAGAKAKGTLQSMVNTITPVQPSIERRDSEPASPSSGKALKHKKSGFMRMFGKDKDAPPVPNLADTYSTMNSQNSGIKFPISKPTRVPVPLLSTNFTDPPEDELRGDTPSTDSTTRHSPNRKAPPPALQIPSHESPSSKGHSQTSLPQTRTLLVPNSETYDRSPGSLPLSAPANVTQFPSLRLRPVSTTFSSKFGDEFLARDSQPSLDMDFSTSSSPTSAISPITPGLSSRSILGDKDIKPSNSTSSKPSEDQSAIIQSLQEQILSAKKAWQRHIWELEGQVRDLKAEVDDLRATPSGDYCHLCRRGGPPNSAIPINGTDGPPKASSVINRPRARTGISSSRFGGIV